MTVTQPARKSLSWIFPIMIVLLGVMPSCVVDIDRTVVSTPPEFDDEGCTEIDREAPEDDACEYSGRRHRFLANPEDPIVLTLCEDHFPPGSPARIAVEDVVAHLNGLKGIKLTFEIAAKSLPHKKYDDARKCDGINFIDIVDVADCSGKDCDFKGRCRTHPESEDPITGFDIVFDDAKPWHFGGAGGWIREDDSVRTYFRLVLLHELMHGVGFQHTARRREELSILGNQSGGWLGQRKIALKAFDIGHLREHYGTGEERDPDLVLSNYTTYWKEVMEKGELVWKWKCELTPGLSRSHAEPGAAVKVTWTSMNSGRKFKGSFATKVVLSKDRRIDARDRVLFVRRSADRGGFVEYSTVLDGAVVTIPSDVRAGTYYLGVIVDADDEVPEVREDNNVLTIHRSLEVRDPD